MNVIEVVKRDRAIDNIRGEMDLNRARWRKMIRIADTECLG